MIESATGENCEVFMLAYSARSLKWHMGEEYFSERFNILHGKYDYCIIQEQAHPMTEESDTITYAGRIIELCDCASGICAAAYVQDREDCPRNMGLYSCGDHLLSL
ncbi:hypothetical protein [Butyrivibrio sp. AE3004]|uniref:hypothetical protein n=1 Tax=Butyrivibrio sp. AE3004 TaxID=1506994 RepID=UPI00068F749F|nr:hypothetical protein [Butyrivibrio sp. AE3004]